MLNGKCQYTASIFSRCTQALRSSMAAMEMSLRDLIVAIAIDNTDFTECVAEYQRRGVTVYERINTSIYSKRILDALGLNGAIRVSPLHCHGTDDIDEFLRITAKIARYARQR